MGNYFDQFDPPGAPPIAAPPAMPGTGQAPIPPAPPGALPSAWRADMTTDVAKNSNDILKQAQASRESLPELEKLADLYTKAPDDAFGTFKGGDIFNNWLRPAMDKVGVPGEQSLLEWHQALNEQRNRVALPQIKSELGAVPRGVPGENAPAKMALDIIPGTNSVSKDAAMAGIDSARDAYFTDITKAIQAQRLRPQDVLKQAAPQMKNGVPVDTGGGELRPGSAFISSKWDGKSQITPDLIKRIPLKTPGAAQ